MRIIKHGNQYEIGQKTCPICKCEFAYTKSDIKEEYERNDECDINVLYCPECKTRIII